MSYYVNPNFMSIERIFPMQNRYGYLRYDLNENPEGLPEEFIRKVLNKVNSEFLSIYPEPDKFTKKYSEFIGVGFNNVMPTSGSDMGIRYLFETFGKPGSEVVTVSPTFEMYWVNCMLMGLKHVPVSYNADLTISVDRIIGAINENTSIVVLLNPNNPIGNAYSEEEVRAVIEKAKSVNAIVIIDEAYHYFYSKTFLDTALENENVVVLRTFSKLFSMAACRLGVIIGNERIIGFVKQSKLSFEVNSFALLFGEMILEEEGLLESLIKTAEEGKTYAVEELERMGYECRNGHGNFIFVKPNHSPAEVARKLKEEKKILVHTFGNELLKDYLRISTGSVNSMKIFIEAFCEEDK